MNNGGKAQVIVADLLQPADRQRIADACSSLPNGLHGLTLTMRAESLRLVRRSNGRAFTDANSSQSGCSYLVDTHIIALLAKTKNAQILNIGSTLGSIGYPGYTAYCASA